MAISNSTTLNDLVGSIIAQEAVGSAQAARVMRNIVSVYEVPLGAGSITVPVFSGLSEGSLTEGVAPSSTTWNTDGLTLTPVERGIYVQISKRVLHADPFSDLTPYGEELGRTLASGEDNAVLGIAGSGVWSTTAQGTLGVNISGDIFRNAISQLEAQNAPKPYFAVLHPASWAKLSKEFGAADVYDMVGAQIVNGFGEGYPSLNGYVGSPYGIPTFISTNVSSDAGNRYNVMFSKRAIALAIMKDIGIDVFDNVTARAFDIMAWRSAHQGITNPYFGVTMYDDV